MKHGVYSKQYSLVKYADVSFIVLIHFNDIFQKT